MATATEAEVGDTLLSLTVSGNKAGLVTAISFYAEETISLPFLVTVDFISDQQNIDPAAVLYQAAVLKITVPEGPVNYFHGMIRRITATGVQLRSAYTYNIEIVPKLWFLSQTQDCRVFQDQTTEQILQTLFDEFDIFPVQFKIFGDKPKRDYTVQWNESDYDFMARLLQEEGWFYYFVHADTSDTLIVTDSNTAFQRLDQPEMQFSGTPLDYSYLSDWRPAGATTLGETSLKDYDPVSPKKKLEAKQNTTQKTPGANLRKFFRWPALTFDPEQVDRRTRIQIEAAEAVVSLGDGSGWHNGFVPGAKFTLTSESSAQANNQEYVIRSVVHRGSEDVRRSSPVGTTNAAAVYHNTFSAFPTKQTWRELLTIPRPPMHGIYSATVIGPEGDEIYTDDYGRVRVHFPWDRSKDSNPGSWSVWLRVIQPWVGKNWGWQFIPRVGTEVAVAFINGDIDRPVVVGGLYNGDYMPPFTLPDQKTKSGIRTRSTLQGGTADYNEFSFEDKKGQELVLLHAQKDHKVEVEHDETITIDGSRQKKVGGSESDNIGGKWTVEVGKTITITTDTDSIHLKAPAGSITLEAATSIELTVGGSSIKMDPASITLKSTMIKVTADAQLELKSAMIKAAADAMLDLKGAMTQVNGDGMLILKGGIVMIN